MSKTELIAKAMIEEAEDRGLGKSDCTILETTSGNTGIGLAAIAAAKGSQLQIYMQDGVSEERTKVIRAYGTEVIPFSVYRKWWKQWSEQREILWKS